MAIGTTTLSIVDSGANVVVSWSGGIQPFWLEQCTALGQPWTKLGDPTQRRSATIPKVVPVTKSISLPPGPDGTADTFETTPTVQRYFRLTEAVPLFDIDVSRPTPLLFWVWPELE